MDHEPVSLAEAQRRLGFTGDREGRRLLRHLEAREAACGHEIVTRQRRGRQTRHSVTIAAIRKYAPDLIPSRVDALLSETRRYLEAIDERIDERVAEQVALHVEPELEKLRNADAKIAEQVRNLAASVHRLSLAKSP